MTADRKKQNTRLGLILASVAVVLPMVMDHQPRQVVDEVEIRIPGQDEKPFAPKFAVTPVEKVAPKATEPPHSSTPTPRPISMRNGIASCGTSPRPT